MKIEYSKEMEEKLQDFGGGFIPDFGYREQLEFDETKGWKLLAECINKQPKHERLNNVISNLKVVKLDKFDKMNLKKAKMTKFHPLRRTPFGIIDDTPERL
jgi:hypothetical protein